MLKTINGGKAPTKGSKYSAAIDLYANEDVVIGAGETTIVPLGVCIDENFILYDIGCYEIKGNGEINNGNEKSIQEFLKSHYLQLEPRSSLRAKGLQAGTGIIDLDYKDEIKIILHNPHYFINNEYWCPLDNNQIGLPIPQPMKEDFKINKGDKIAQIMLKEHKTYLMGINTEDERSGGFGSTGA